MRLNQRNLLLLKVKSWFGTNHLCLLKKPETIEKEFNLQRLNYMSAINTASIIVISGSEAPPLTVIERLRKKTGVVRLKRIFCVHSQQQYLMILFTGSSGI